LPLPRGSVWGRMPQPSPMDGFMRLPRGRGKKRAKEQDSATAHPQERVHAPPAREGQEKGEETRQNTQPDPQERFHAPPKRQGQAEGGGTRGAARLVMGVRLIPSESGRFLGPLRGLR